MSKFPHYKQLDAMDCGPTCLRMVAKHYGKTYSLQYLRSRSYITREVFQWSVSAMRLRVSAVVPKVIA